ncbi:MAG: porin, partial [Polaribacter sp.]
MKLPQLRNVVILGCICAFLNVNAQESNAPKFGKGLFNLIGQDSTWSMKVGLRFQTLATSKWDVNNGVSNPESSMLIRRSRLKFDG